MKGARRWRCAFCGHVYDEALGDPETGIPPSTALEDLPPDWFCPECGAYASDYLEIE